MHIVSRHRHSTTRFVTQIPQYCEAAAWQAFYWTDSGLEAGSTRKQVRRAKRGKRKTYQLLEIPVANLHVSALLIHALRELRRRTGAVVLLLLRLLRLHRRGLLLSGRRATAGEKAADGMADGGADGDTTT